MWRVHGAPAALEPGPLVTLVRWRTVAAVRRVTEAVADDLADSRDPAEVEQAVEGARRHYADAPVRDFVPILVEREARAALTETSDQSDG